MDEDQTPDSLTFQDIEIPEGCVPAPVPGKLGPVELDWIGCELREYYDSVLREPVPNKFLALLDRSLARRTFH
ncbi:NepR family anti-sigma factor [Microvirga arabica]|uniref:NepR family anti-sigma factor n=1 Tax=Microvirga arabica TaxID=1128671 RepID=A0ABV6YAB6_9HYPH